MSILSLEVFLGLILGIGVGVFIMIIILVNVRKDHSIKAKYDERQELARGKGYKAAFFTLLIYFGLMYVAEISMEETIPMQSTLIIIGISIGIMVYANYAIFHDAYFSLNDKANKYIYVFSALAFFNLIGGVMRIVDGIQNGTPLYDLGWTNIIVGIMVLEILIVIGIKKLIDRKENSEE